MTTELITMPEQQQHPSVEDLTAFSVGQLSSFEAQELERHIETCQPCGETLLGLSGEDTFVALLKDAKENDETKDAKDAEDENSTLTSEFALAAHPRYEIVGMIAQGGMGEVFKARHRIMERTVALKVINRDLMRKPEAVERFHREVKTAACLSHPNIVRAYDAEQAEGLHFLVMEHVDGVNLADLIKKDGPMSVTQACECIQQAAVGLQQAHEQGMVHRDIKPHNLMLTIDGTVKILDFGLASLATQSVASELAGQSQDSSLTATGTIMGTPDYISPEQANDAHQADIRSDIYSLGATFYYLLSGKPPFAEGSVAEKLKCHADTEPTPIATFRPEVPKELSDIIQRMMSKNLKRRFQTPQQVANALAPFVDLQRFEKPEARPIAIDNSKSEWWPKTIVTVALGSVGLFLMGILYLVTDKGTLEIDSPDDQVHVTISKVMDATDDDYLQLSVVDTVTGSKIVRLASGEYKVSLSEHGNKYEVHQGGFTLRRGEKIVVKVTRKEGSEPTPEEMELKTMDIPSMAQQQFVIEGFRLTADAAKELQIKADADPTDIPSRLQLLGYYQNKSLLNAKLRDSHLQLAQWVVTNYPDSEAAGSHAVQIDASMNPAGYMIMKNLWLKQVEAHSENAKILGNTANYFLLSDRGTAEKLLQQAQTLEPNNEWWAERLGNLYKLGLIGASADEGQKNAAKALVQFELAMSQNKTPQKESSLRVELAKVAFESGQTEKAKTYADQLLKADGKDVKDWNSGNAVHTGNIILGRLALLNGDLDAAKSHLLAAGKTTGSPQLNSFGPNMQLARELLEKGEKDVVLEYFELCGKFWKNNNLAQWTATVKGGGIPEFGMSLVH